MFRSSPRPTAHPFRGVPHLMIRTAVCLLALWSLAFTTTADAFETRWGGYVRAIGTRTFPDDDSIYQFVGMEALDDFQGMAASGRVTMVQ